MSRYLVISSDCHAGLPNEQYRDWLDPAHRGAFDEAQAARAATEQELVDRGLRNEAFAEEWERENEEGLRGGWDAARRDKELDADGVAGEVIFPDADAVTGGASAPFGAGLGTSGDQDPALLLAGAAGPQPLARRALRRQPGTAAPASPSSRSSTTSTPRVAEIRRAATSGLRGGILIPSMWQPYPPYHDDRYDPIWATCRTSTCRSTSTPARPTRRPTASTSASTSPRCGGGRCAPCGSCCGPAPSTGSRASSSWSPSAARSGRPTCSGPPTSSTTVSTRRRRWAPS